MRPIVAEKIVKFRDPRLNHSREFPPEAVGGGIFDILFAIGHHIRCVVDYVGTDVRAKFGDSRSNGSQDIRWAKRTNTSKRLKISV